jgi:lipopolysaccharide/colanic/teichoic acid biosynthesis glycosyltransferase
MAVLPIAVGLVHARYTSPRYRFGTQNSIWAYLGLAVIHLFAAHVAGIPDEVEEVQPALALSVLTGLAATGVWTALQLARPGALPRRVVFISGILAAILSFVASTANVRMRRRQGRRERVAAVLTGPEAFSFLDADDVEATHSTMLLHELLTVEEPTTIVLSDRSSTNQLLVDSVTDLHRRGVRVRTLSGFYPEYFGKVALHDLSRMAMLFDVKAILNPRYRRTKRAIDLFGAFIAGLVCGAIVPFVLLGNAIGNRGKLLFRQTRIGLNGKPFVLVKFRTMNAADDDEFSWTSFDDPRITTFGRILRRTHLDELPQFINVLQGDLSLVGPRPEQPHYVDELRAKEVAYELRHLVLPGLTGWAQIKLRYGDTEAAAIEKLQYDLYYLQNQSLALDARILSRTLRSVIRHEGR